MYKHLIYIPGFAFLYYVFAVIFGWPYTIEVLGILAGVTTIFGIRLNARLNHYDGDMVVETNEDGRKVFSLNFEQDPETLEYRDSISFKVVKTSVD